MKRSARWLSFSSVARAVTGRELWNGNREDWRRWASPEHPIRWAYSTHARRRTEFQAALGPGWVRLRSRRQIRTWLAACYADRVEVP